MSRRLQSRLLIIGRAAGARSESGGIRFFALALSSLTLAMALASVIAAIAVNEARDSRISEGHLIPALESTPTTSTTHVKLVIDHLREGRQYTVVFLSPGGKKAPLPPGLDQWPEPGTAVSSPELLREGARQGISGRYGEIVDTIGESGLADATELLVYVRPEQDLSTNQSDTVITVSGFGSPVPPIPFQNVHWLLADQDFFPNTLVWLIVGLGVIPSILLTLAACRVASHSRDRRDALITVLGGRMPHRLWVATGEAWIPITLGAFTALGLMYWFAAADRRLPAVDYVVAASDIHGLWWAFGLCALASAAFVLCTAVMQSGFGIFSMSGNRPRQRSNERTRSVLATLFPCFILLAAVVPYWLPSSFTARSFIGYVGLIGMVITMPVTISVGIAALGRGLRRWGHQHQRPTPLTSGARLAHRPAAVARQIFGVCACILFLLFALTWQSNFISAGGAYNSFIDKYGYSLVEVHPRGEVTPGEVSAFTAAVPDDIMVVAYMQSTLTGNDAGNQETKIRLTGTCPALKALSLPCLAEDQQEPADGAAPVLSAWLNSIGDGDQTALTVASGAPSSALKDEHIALLAFSVEGNSIAAGVLPNAGAVFQFGVATSVPGVSGDTAASPFLEQSGWITLIGGFGLGILVFATGLGLASEFLRFGREIAPLSIMAGNRRIFWLSAAFISLVPLAAAVTGGFVLGVPAMRPLANTGVNLITPTFIVTACAIALAVGIGMWIWSTAAALNSADHWRPGRDDD